MALRTHLYGPSLHVVLCGGRGQDHDSSHRPTRESDRRRPGYRTRSRRYTNDVGMHRCNEPAMATPGARASDYVLESMCRGSELRAASTVVAGPPNAFALLGAVEHRHSWRCLVVAEPAAPIQGSGAGRVALSIAESTRIGGATTLPACAARREAPISKKKCRNACCASSDAGPSELIHDLNRRGLKATRDVGSAGPGRRTRSRCLGCRASAPQEWVVWVFNRGSTIYRRKRFDRRS